MRRLPFLLLALAVSLLCLSMISMRAVAHDDDEDSHRIKICHVVSSIERPNGVVFYVGRVITVSRRAYRRHRAHGDVRVGQAAVEGQCCAFTVLPDGTVLPGRVD